jgi:Arc/MetJ-type ribon-helix-helix transcriptional regulator
MKITSVSLDQETTDRLDELARGADRSRSFVVRKLLESALDGESRIRALDAIAEINIMETCMSKNHSSSTDEAESSEVRKHFDPKPSTKGARPSRELTTLGDAAGKQESSAPSIGAKFSQGGR